MNCKSDGHSIDGDIYHYAPCPAFRYDIDKEAVVLHGMRLSNPQQAIKSSSGGFPLRLLDFTSDMLEGIHEMTTSDKQFINPLLADVPRKNWQKMFFKAPLQAWRFGFRFLLPPNFACITTQGHKSGLPRHTMVEFSEVDGKYYFVSGWQGKPHWVQNLMAYPQITVHPVHGEPIWGTAERVQDDATLKVFFEAMQVSPMWKPWLASLDIEPTVEDFIAHKDRLYIYGVSPDKGNIVLPTLPQDRRWVVWAVLGVMALMSRILFRLRQSQKQS